MAVDHEFGTPIVGSYSCKSRGPPGFRGGQNSSASFDKRSQRRASKATAAGVERGVATSTVSANACYLFDWKLGTRSHSLICAAASSRRARCNSASFSGPGGRLRASARAAMLSAVRRCSSDDVCLKRRRLFIRSSLFQAEWDAAHCNNRQRQAAREYTIVAAKAHSRIQQMLRLIWT